MLMYNLIEYIGNYSQASGRLWQYYRDESALDDDGDICNFLKYHNNNSASFKFKHKITGETENDRTKDAKIMISSKYLSNF